MFTPEYFFSTACLLFMFSSVFCAVVRWTHMCRPYDRKSDYYYPARFQVTMTFLGFLAQLPYVWQPMDGDTWIYIKAFNLLFYPAVLSITLRRYFMRERVKDRPYSRIQISFMSALGLVFLYFSLSKNADFAVFTERHFGWALALNILVALAGILFVIDYVSVARWIIRQINRYHNENFSNPEDFPLEFAKRVVLAPMAVFVPTWIMCFLQTHWFYFGFCLLTTVLEIGYLVAILHPQRVVATDEPGESEFYEVKDPELPMVDSGVSPRPTISDEKMWQIKEAIEREMLTNRSYLNNHFTQAELAKMVGSNRTYISLVCNQYYGGFFRMVNRYRLDHAARYQAEHPDAIQEEIAQASGFPSRQAYQYVLKKFEEYASGVNPKAE